VKPARARADHRTRVGRERSARTERRILEAALEVFADRGPDAPAIDDFVQAAGIARGTFYYHFKSVAELLRATSERTTREVLQGIEDAVTGLDTAAMRLGVGLRMFLAHAQENPVWCRFVARVWKIGGLELPYRDLDEGVRLGQFRVPGREAAHDLLFGGIREALQRIGEGGAPPGFGDQLAETCLQALGAERKTIEAALARELPGAGESGRAERAGRERRALDPHRSRHRTR